jgi:hypothetical protein
VHAAIAAEAPIQATVRVIPCEGESNEGGAVRSESDDETRHYQLTVGLHHYGIGKLKGPEVG